MFVAMMSWNKHSFKDLQVKFNVTYAKIRKLFPLCVEFLLNRNYRYHLYLIVYENRHPYFLFKGSQFTHCYFTSLKTSPS